jgi:amidase
MSHPPILTGEKNPETLAAAFGLFNMPFSLTGQPAISLPLHWSSEGLPVGIQLIADYGREDLLLRLSAQLEVTRPWVDRQASLNR